jgi:protein gp37
MAEQTAISWADATFNPWIGCDEVSIERTGGGGCDHCYARELAQRYGWAKWGPKEPRHRTKDWGAPLRWDRKAAKAGTRPRVFCASLADVFDTHVDPQWRTDLWQIIRDTPNLRWMLLTKRIGNAARMLPPDWPFENAGLMATIVNQMEFDRDYHKLAETPATWHGISMEPLLGEIHIGEAKPDWIITGGESGRYFRHTNPDWIRSLREQCQRNDIAFHFKQWGGVNPKANGCELDGREYKAFPAALANPSQDGV